MQINVRYCKLGGLLFLALATIATVKKADENAAEHQARAQVVGQVEPLFRALFPDQNVLRFQALRTPQYHKGHLMTGLWAVDCQDKNSNVIASALWNAETHWTLRFAPTLFHTSLTQKPSPRQPIEEKIEEKRAVALAREWTARLRPVSDTALQQSEYQTQHMAKVWTVCLQLPDSRVFVWIDALSGELVNATIQEMPLSDTPDANREKQR